jgi:threonine dehydrogenase-like Zn-dependent dehydrogenase
MVETTLAAVLTGPNQFEVRDLPIPEVADGGLLRIEACGVCGSDARIRNRTADNPKIMGHENVGTVARIGRAAAERWGVREGDRIALEEYVPCGACKWCRSELFRYCPKTEPGAPGRLWYGSTPLSVWPSLWGGYAEYVYIHPNAVIHKVPAHVPAVEATAFIPLANGVELACGYGGVAIGSAVLIQGPGEHGLAAVIAAKAAGAASIIVAGLSRDASRLEIARRIGAHHTLDVEQEDLVGRVRELTGGDGVDVVINCSGGGTHTTMDALAAAAKVATIVVSDAGRESIEVGAFGRRELTIRAANGHSYQSVERAIQMIASGDYPIEALTAPPYTLDRAAEAIDAAAGLTDPAITFVTILPTLSGR